MNQSDQTALAPMPPSLCSATGSTGDAIEIVPYTPADRTDVVALLNRCLNSRTQVLRTEEYWDWKHHQNPAGDSLILLAKAGEQIVGARAFLRWQLIGQGQVWEAYRPVDTVTHPDWQRKGIFSRLTRAALERIPTGSSVVFNTPNAQSLPGYLKLGWQQLGRLPVRMRILHPVRMAYRLIRKQDEGRSWLESRGGEEQTLRDWAETGPELESLFRYPPPTAETWRTRKTESWFWWRYRDHPTTRYFVAAVGPSKAPQAVAVYRHNVRRGMREVVVNELLGEPATFGALIRQIRSASSADYLIALQADPGQALRRVGFFRTYFKEIELTARTADGLPGAVPLPPAGAWAFSFGDLEGL